MQPYFFPYIGYFQLIHAAADWVVFDTAQYIRHGWVNRNRILHPQAGPKYVILPLAHHSREARIADLELHPEIDWKSRIMAQVTDYYRKGAPRFAEVIALLDQALDASERSLNRLLVRCLAQVCRYLGMPFEPRMSSEIELDPTQVDHPGQWALRIAQALGATRYLNPIGGRELFVAEEFEAAGIDLVFLESREVPYPQGLSEFHERLSIIDVLMWNSVEETRALLECYRLIPASGAEAARARA